MGHWPTLKLYSFCFVEILRHSINLRHAKRQDNCAVTTGFSQNACNICNSQLQAELVPKKNLASEVFFIYFVCYLLALQDLNLRPSSGCASWKVEPDYFRAATIKTSIESLVAGAGFEQLCQLEG